MLYISACTAAAQQSLTNPLSGSGTAGAAWLRSKVEATCVLPSTRTNQTQLISINMQKNRCAVEQKGTNLRYVPISMTSTRRGPSPSSCTPSQWEGPPEPLWSALLHRSLEFSNFVLMFATGRSSWVTAEPQGAEPRGTGQCMPPAHASSIPKQPLLAARAEGAQVTAPHQQDLQ